MRKVIVTGGLGFIGSHVVDGFLAAGDEVLVIDSMVASVVEGADYDGHPSAEVRRESIEEFLGTGGDFRGADLVVHAAAHVGPAGILQYQGSLGASIVTSTQMTVDACLEAGVPLCAFSSAEVYGRSGALAEDDSIIVPTSYNARIEYAIAKTLTEAITLNNRHRGLEAIVVRPFNVAGPRQSSAGGFVMPTFVQQAQAGEPLTVFATGRQVRAFLAATDLARFMTDHLDAAFATGRPIFNLGNPANAMTVWDLAERVVTLLKSPSPVVYADATEIHGPLYHEAESFEKRPVLEAAPLAGWQPEVGLDALIRETAAYYEVREDPRTPVAHA